MGNVLIYAEHQDGSIKRVSLELAAKAAEIAKELGGEAHAIFIGAPPSEAKTLGRYGINKVTVITHEKLSRYNSEAYTNVAADFIKKSAPLVFLATASAQGKDFIPRLAARLDTGLASDCTDLRVEGGKLIPTRPVYSGKALVDVEMNQCRPIMVTTRPNSFPVRESGTNEAIVETISVDPGMLRAPVIEIEAGQSKEVDLTEAEIIISGGRSIKDPSNFKMLRECAAVLGASVGASRAAVDSGFAPHSMQVGQTGKVVNPNLYIACGISGAIQHLAGMRTSKVIVAINKDPEAPIFQKADYGVVGDIFEIIPLLTEEFKKLKSVA